jgi:hypothetical protein
MDEQTIRMLVKQMDTTRDLDIEAAWVQLRSMGEGVVPYLAEYYPQARKWQCRVWLVYHAIRYARTSDDAFKLGLAARNDRARLVRYRACGLLAYSLRRDALPALRGLLQNTDPATAADATAAIDAIEHHDHHRFVRSGFWQVNEGDVP